MKDPVPLK